MIFHPAVIALITGSLLISSMLLYSSYYGWRILRKWDLQSGSELQLELERRTYLISTLMNYAFGFQLLSLFLFVYTVDGMSTLFVGAMCAAGSLNVNSWGYPAIVMKIMNSILAGLWLIVNYTDNKAYDYPLIKVKYALLILICPVILTEAFIQCSYFLGLEPDVITSCCGALFSSSAEGVTSGIVAFPHVPAELAFYSSMLATFFLGTCFYYKGRGGLLFALMSFITFLVCVIALISFISLYIYELPTHHCPFCVLHKEYNFVGYPLYLSFLGGAVAGLGVGLIMPFNKIGSLQGVVPAVQRRLTLICLLFYAMALAIVVYSVAFSNLSLRS